MAKITDFTAEQIEAAIKAEALSHARFFNVGEDAEAILGRERVSRANIGHINRTGTEVEICDYLIPFIPASSDPAVVYVEVSGLTGSGKSAVMGEIEIAMRALGISVEHDDDFQSEKNMTHADWQKALELYQPRVVLRERNIPRSTTA